MTLPTPRKPIERTRIGPVLAKEIAAFIAAESLAEGAHLRTAELARRFAVSRWPVEQALKALAAEGLVRHEPNKGFYVSRPGVDASARMPARDPIHEAYLAIAALLVRGEIGPQTSEQELRARFGLTRRQTGDLLARLAHEGIAEKRAGYGWDLRAELTTPEALAQTYQLRLLIEPGGLRLPGYHLAPEVIARLRQTEEDLLAGGIERLAPDALYHKATQFHESLIAGTGNPFLVQTLVRVNRVRRLLTYQSMQDRRRYYAQSEEHLRILHLIETGRRDEAAEAMRDHISRVMVSLRALGMLPSGEAEVR